MGILDFILDRYTWAKSWAGLIRPQAKWTTQLKLNGTLSNIFATSAEISHGSPLSPILYIYYNSDLLDITGEDELGFGFIDDPDGMPCIVDDYHVLHSETVKDHTSLGYYQLHARALIRGKIDLTCAYHQILMEIADIHKMAFKTLLGCMNGWSCLRGCATQ